MILLIDIERRMELMDAAEKGEVIDPSDKSRKCGFNFAAHMIVKAI